MKKLIIPILMLFIGQAGVMRAADTDISTLDNVIYITSFQASPGTTSLQLSIKMKNTADIRGFQFDLVLPEGITPVEDGGEYVYWLNADRAPKKAGGQFYHTLEVTKQTNGSYRFLSGAQADKTFTGNDGEVAVILVDIAADMEAGDYPILLKDMKLTETDISKFYVADEIESTVTIGEADGRIKFDETSTTLPTYTVGEKGNITMKRTIKANEWSTIVLPFNLTKTNATKAFGEDVQFAQFSGFEVDYGDDEENITPLGITIKLTEYSIPSRSNLAGGTPVLIKTSQDITEIKLDEVTLTEGVTNVEVEDEYGTPGKLTGTLVKTKIPADGLFISENKFWYSTGQTNVKAFRCWFELGAVLGEETDFGARVFLNFEDDETTDIKTIDGGQSTVDSYYDLQGRKVEKPVKGLYIKGGKTVVIK